MHQVHICWVHISQNQRNGRQDKGKKIHTIKKQLTLKTKLDRRMEFAAMEIGYSKKAFEALTQVQRSKFQDAETKCILCCVDEETMRHLVIDCEVLGKREVTIDVALGSTYDSQEITITKKRLAKWGCKQK